MLKKWNKTALIVVPLLVVGSVATFAAENAQSANKQATASAPSTVKAGQNDTVTSQVVASQTLTPEELQQLQQAQPAATTASSTTASTGAIASSSQDQSLIDANNPFLVQGNTGSTSTTGTASASGSDSSSSANGNGGTSAEDNNFSLDLVKNMDITMNTTQGMLTLHFRTDGGQIKLDGDLGGRHVTLAGDQAEQILNGLLQQANLSDALTASLNGQQVNLDASLLGALQTLHVELKDGRKIDTNPHGAKAPAPKGPPHADGPHDNGKHKGQEKGRGHGDD